MLGINNNNIKKKLLQVRKLTLTKDIHVCRNSEKTMLQVKKISADNTANAVEINAFVINKTRTGSCERGLSDLIVVMGGPIKPDADIAPQLTSEKMSYLQHLEIVAVRAGRENHFAKVCMQKEKIQRKKSIQAGNTIYRLNRDYRTGPKRERYHHDGTRSL